MKIKIKVGHLYLAKTPFWYSSDDGGKFMVDQSEVVMVTQYLRKFIWSTKGDVYFLHGSVERRIMCHWFKIHFTKANRPR